MDFDNRLLVDYVVDAEHDVLLVDVPAGVDLLILPQLQLLVLLAELLVQYQNADMA